MTDNELLLAISDMMDTKLKVQLQPLKNDIQAVNAQLHRLQLQHETIIMPRLDTIESCYVDTSRRYLEDTEKMEAAFEDVDLLKKVVMDHSQKLQKLT